MVGDKIAATLRRCSCLRGVHGQRRRSTDACRVFYRRHVSRRSILWMTLDRPCRACTSHARAIHKHTTLQLLQRQPAPCTHSTLQSVRLDHRHHEYSWCLWSWPTEPARPRQRSRGWNGGQRSISDVSGIPRHRSDARRLYALCGFGLVSNQDRRNLAGILGAQRRTEKAWFGASSGGPSDRSMRRG